METGVLEKLVEQDFGIVFNGSRWARSAEHDSLVIDREKQLFYWNAQNVSGDAYVYLTRVRKLNPQDAKELLKNFGFSGTFIHEIKDGGETVVYPKLVDVFHEAIWKVDRSYFHNRTITDETISRFKLGYSDGFYTIPIYQDGVFKQIQMRRDSPKLIRNYYKDVGPLLFNSDILKLTNKIFLTEGLIGAIVLNQNGIPAISMNIGCDGFQAAWVKYFIHQKEIYILFDNDIAGVKGAVRTAKILGEYKCKIYNFEDFDGKGYAVDDAFIDGVSAQELLDIVYANSKHSYELLVKKW